MRSARPALLLLPLLGCATMPRTGAELPVAPLVVDVEQVEWRVPSTVAPEPGAGPLRVELEPEGWQLRQGDWLVDDEDFFRIAGDLAAAEEVRSFREGAHWQHHAGLAAALLGLAGAGATVAMSTEPSGVRLRGEGAVGLSVSAVCMFLGGALASVGWARLQEDVHPLPAARAARAAEAYNSARGFATKPLPHPVGYVRSGPAARPPADSQTGFTAKDLAHWKPAAAR